MSSENDSRLNLASYTLGSEKTHSWVLHVLPDNNIGNFCYNIIWGHKMQSDVLFVFVSAAQDRCANGLR